MPDAVEQGGRAGTSGEPGAGVRETQWPVAGGRKTYNHASAVSWPSCDGIEPTSWLVFKYLRTRTRQQASNPLARAA